jgi:hypothetical protein
MNSVLKLPDLIKSKFRNFIAKSLISALSIEISWRDIDTASNYISFSSKRPLFSDTS